MEKTQAFEAWAIVELLGHSKIAGKITEQPLAGTNFLRVDVPETSTTPAFTRFIGGSAIYAINPCTEEVVKYIANNLQVKPIETWDINRFNEKMKAISSGDAEML